MLGYYVHKLKIKIKMISMHNKLCNKQDGLFSYKSYLHKGQGSLNEFEKTYKTI